MSKTTTIFALFSISLLIIFAGCSTLGTGSEVDTSTPVATPASTSTPEEMTTPEQTATPAVTAEETTTETESTETDEYAERRKKYVTYDTVNRNTLSSLNISVIESSVHPENKTYKYTVELQNPQNESRNVDTRRTIALSYLADARYLNSGKSDRDHTWIPDTVNVILVTPDGELFETGYLRYRWAYKTYTGEWSSRIYLAHYAGSIEEGPAASDDQ
ncbi:MAG: hypothetical protein ABEH86_05140 [Haloarcula sp.]